VTVLCVPSSLDSGVLLRVSGVKERDGERERASKRDRERAREVHREKARERERYIGRESERAGAGRNIAKVVGWEVGHERHHDRVTQVRLDKFEVRLPEKWLKPRPESGRNCLVCANDRDCLKDRDCLIWP
jgi:hypothetical protein